MPCAWKGAGGFGEGGEANKTMLEAKFGNSELSQYRKEMIHVAAVAIAAIESFDRSSGQQKEE